MIQLICKRKPDRLDVWYNGICPTLESAMGMGGNNCPLVFEVEDDVREESDYPDRADNA